MQNRQEVLSLTGLRFVAAFWVFLFHIQIRWPLSNNFIVKNILDQGAIGMSIFFMLSGFLLAYRYADASSTFKVYLVARLARIYPIYLVAAVVTLPWLGINFDGNSLQGILHSVAKTCFLIVSNVFLVQAWFPPFFGLWNDGASWSISVEAFCYLILPLTFPILINATKKKLFFVILMCYCLSLGPGISASLYESPLSQIYYSVPIFRLPEFLIGACIYFVKRQGYEFQRGIVVQVMALSLFLAYLGIAGPNLPLYVGHNWVAVPFIGFFIYSLSSDRGTASKVLSLSAFMWLGKISYCFYSFQALYLLLLIDNHGNLVQILPVFLNNNLLAIAVFIVLTASSAVGYYFIENPARKWVIQKLTKAQ